ncbi:MAG: AI-2E family transporter [Candidatus Izemoplasmatales bacterium]|nr:AI-2E family transporter [Candidatus Izemoplasmatales bacterium]MDD4354762.1 AI-2E family transporter [Candidatus Izemoplasmatales bacterium]MDD4987686.1 AI-2E family transporter [Candidatus Izemoplasmatales bacterium]MDY0372949.1 AI-2E family transporter [Candidatus Izemoplasmatales bacterium]NLF48214.1 AI-2E family transporter [Acholeplasmataceae bacterium]
MKKKPISDDRLNRIIKYLAIALLFLAVLFMAVQFSSVWSWIIDAIKAVIVPVGLAYLSALIMFPLIKYLEKKGIGPRGLSLAIVFLLSVGIIFALFYFVTPFVVSEITDFFNDEFPKILDYLTGDLRDDFIFGTDAYDRLFEYLEESDLINNWLNATLPNLLNQLGSFLFPLLTAIAILPILLIYYLLDYEMLSDRLRSIIPQKQEKAVAELGSRLNQTVGAYLRGQILLMLAIGTVATIVYKLIGLKYYFVFGVLVGITNIIPYFGTILAALPPTIYTFIIGGTPGPLLVLGVNVVLQFIEGNIFQPIIMAHQLQMHPLVIITSILFFGSLFGALGVIFASPIAASIRVIWQFFREQRQAANMTPITGGDASP